MWALLTNSLLSSLLALFLLLASCFTTCEGIFLIYELRFKCKKKESKQVKYVSHFLRVADTSKILKGEEFSSFVEGATWL